MIKLYKLSTLGLVSVILSVVTISITAKCIDKIDTFGSAETCDELSKRCDEDRVRAVCPVTCGTCDGSETTTTTAAAATARVLAVEMECLDYTKKFRKDIFKTKKKKKCPDYIKRCEKYEKVARLCPVMCDTCVCGDFPDKIPVYKKGKKKCDWVRKKKTEKVEKICSKETAVREHCPQTCASCPTPTNGWTQLGTDIINTASSNDFYPQGNEVAMSGDGTTVVVAKPGSPFAYVGVHRYSQKDFSWNQIGSDIAWVTDGRSTPACVSMSQDGNTFAVGLSDLGTENGLQSGVVRVYTYNENSSSWDQDGSDINGKAPYEFFGTSVSISSDGTALVVGARNRCLSDMVGGQIRVYYNYYGYGSSWEQFGGDIEGTTTGECIGGSVSISPNGSLVAVGTIHNSLLADDKEYVRVYCYACSYKTGMGWGQIGSDIDGISVSLAQSSQYGPIVAIGAPNRCNYDDTYGYVGIYKYNGFLDSWDQLGSDIYGETACDLFGKFVSISQDGSAVAIGAPRNDADNDADNDFNYNGRVRVFKYLEADSLWDQVGGDIDGTYDRDFSGESVSISDDGKTVALGANGDTIYRARVYVFND